MRLKIRVSYLTCKVADKCLHVCERVEVVERNKDGPSLPLQSCEFSVSVKENLDRSEWQPILNSILKLYGGLQKLKLAEAAIFGKKVVANV